MRVIAGKAKSVPLMSVEGLETRPTTDRIKETLFNMLQTEVGESMFLDLFSGSGAIGIEALSRGAKEVYLVEHDKKAAACIRDNLRRTKLTEDAIVMECDCLSALSRLEQRGLVFDIIFMDPPYGKGLEEPIFAYLGRSRLISEDTIVIVEEGLGEDLEDVLRHGFSISREKKYKTNKHVFFTRRSHEESNISRQF